MSRNRTVFLLGLAALVFSGYSVGQKEPEDVSESRLEEKEEPMFPDRYEEDTDGILSFHADVIPPCGLLEENSELQVVYMEYDFDVALKELFSDVGEINIEESYDKELDYLYQTAYGEDEEMLFKRPGRIYMVKPRWNKAQNAVELSGKDLAYNAEQYKIPREISFGTEEEVWNSLQETLRRLGVESDLQPTFFYMDHKTLKEEDEKNSGETGDLEIHEEKTWSGDDDGYYISAVQCVGGNPVYANTYFGKGIEGEADTANVLAYIDRDGIQMLEISRIIGEMRETDKTWKMLPFEDVVEAVKKRFDLVLTKDRVDIRKMRFSYMTEAVENEVYRLLPVWFCNYEQTAADGMTQTGQLIVNASTGEDYDSVLCVCFRRCTVCGLREKILSSFIYSGRAEKIFTVKNYCRVFVSMDFHDCGISAVLSGAVATFSHDGLWSGLQLLFYAELRTPVPERAVCRVSASDRASVRDAGGDPDYGRNGVFCVFGQSSSGFCNTVVSVLFSDQCVCKAWRRETLSGASYDL